MINVKEMAREIFDEIGTSTSKYFADGSETVPDRVTNRTRGLLNSIVGNTSYSIEETVADVDRILLSKGTRIPYAALLEKGGVRVVTDKMRKFFWAKYFETKDPLWKALRFKNILTYRPRPFLSLGVRDSEPKIKEILNKHIKEYIDLTIKEIIKGTPRAVPLNAIK